MRTYLIFVLTLFTSLTFAQPHFVKKNLNTPASDAAVFQIEFADMDNDGDQDLVGSSVYQDRILIYLNQNGVIDTFPQIVEANVEEFRIVDWNNDNLPDILTTEIDLYLNQGNLNFAEGVTLVNPASNFHLSDVNSDGYVDIVENNYDFIYENDNGTPNINLQTGVDLRGAYADLNNDGMKDHISISTNYPYDLIFQEAVGPYQYAPADTLLDFATVNPNQGACGTVVLAEDLDGDGIEEVIVKACWKIYILKITGNFTYDLIYAGDSFTANTFDFQFTTIADVDQNGFKEIMVNNSIFFNDNFTFIKKNFPFDGNHLYTYFAVADTDGDSKAEVWENYRGLRMARFNYTTGTSISGREEMWKMYPRAGDFGALMDVNNDGAFDLVYPSILNLVLSLNDGNGNYSESVLFNNIDATLPDYEVYPIHYDNDGWMDILVKDEKLNVIRWLRNNQDNTFEDMGALVGIPAFNPIQILAIDDFNNDGLIDIIRESESSVYTRLHYFMNDGTNLVNQQEITSVFSSQYEKYEVFPHDMNGDGFVDIAIAFTSDGGAKTVNVYENNGVDFNHVYGHNMSIYGQWMGWSDMTQDGNKDLCYGKVVNGGTNELVIIPSNGDGTFGTELTQPFYGDFHEWVMKDLNNDGLEDLMTATYISFNTGTGLTPGIPHNTSIGVGSLTQYMDYDQDGDLDIFSNRRGGRGYIWENLLIGENKIFGNVFYDTNGNGIKDLGEDPVSDIKIGVDGFGSYFYSDDSGNFTFPLGGNSGSFEVSSESFYNNQLTFTTSPYPAIANISAQDPVDTVEIGLQTVADTLVLYQLFHNQRCNQVGRMWFHYFNFRSGVSNGQLELNIPNGVTFTGNAAITPTSINGNTLTWDLGNTGVIENENLWLDLLNPNFQSAGDTLTFTSKLQTWVGTDTLTVFDTVSYVLTCAYDPNDKQIINTEVFAQGDAYYTTQDEVEYMIRFQNTGTAPATNVIVRDNFSTNFDYESFQLLSTSHPARVSLSPQGLMEVNFENINLPDSTSNFTESMGYVAFRVRLKENVEREKDISNGARIYFDQNPPIYTNVPKFQRVECDFFLQLQHPVGNICGNEIDSAFVYDYGVPQNYEWLFDNNSVSTLDTAGFYIPGNGTFPLQLITTNKLCSADTLVELTITQSTPLTLGLSSDGDTTVCQNGGVNIQSSIPVIWTYENGISTPPTTSQQFYLTGTYLATNSIGICKLTDSIEVTAVVFDNDPEDFFVDYPSDGYVFCLGDTMKFSSISNMSSYWTYSGTGNQQYNGNPVSIPTDANSGLTTATVQVVEDTLNCQVWANAEITFVDDLNFDNNTSQQYLLCDGITDSVGIDLQTTPQHMDSLQVFQNGNLITTYYENAPTELYLNQAGTFDIIGFLACHETFLTVDIEDFDAMLPNLLMDNDSLYASLGQSVNWFYSEDMNMVFSSISTGSAVLNPADGYYYFSYENGNCIHLSDTVLVETVGTQSLLSKDIKLNFNMENKTIWVKGEIPSGTILEIYDAMGKKISDKKLETTQSILSLPSGIYFAVATHLEKGSQVLKIPIF